MSRIKPTDELGDIIGKMAQQVPLASIALQAAYTHGSCIEPCGCEDQQVGRRAIQTLDQAGIYGESLACLFTEICQCDPVKLLAVCKAVDLGILPIDSLTALRQPAGPRLDAQAILTSVRERLPNFGENALAAKTHSKSGSGAELLTAATRAETDWDGP